MLTSKTNYVYALKDPNKGYLTTSKHKHFKWQYNIAKAKIWHVVAEVKQAQLDYPNTQVVKISITYKEVK